MLTIAVRGTDSPLGIAEQFSNALVTCGVKVDKRSAADAQIYEITVPTEAKQAPAIVGRQMLGTLTHLTKSKDGSLIMNAVVAKEFQRYEWRIQAATGGTVNGAYMTNEQLFAWWTGLASTPVSVDFKEAEFNEPGFADATDLTFATV